MRLLAIVASALTFQSFAPAQATPGFEVASIRVSRGGPAEAGVLKPSPNGITTVNLSFRSLVSWAYNKRLDFIAGSTASVDAVRYDVAAKASGPVQIDALRGMLRGLLAERFHLTAHRETRELPVYAVVAGKNGPKHVSVADPGSPSMMQPGPIGPQQEQRWSMKNTSMANFAGFLERPHLDRPVIDLTGLSGGFDFTFQYPPRDPGMAMLDYWLEEVFPAVEDQLGLKVEPRKSPMEVLVIDHAEAPSED